MSVVSPCSGATVYVTEGSGNSVKPALALAQLGIPHQLRFMDVLGGENRLPSFLAVNPAGQVPYLVDASGFGVAQSNAMLWYIAEGSHLVPEAARDRAAMLQWMFFEQTRLEPNISPARFFTFVLPHREAEFSQQIPRWRQGANEALGLLEAHLMTSDFIVAQHGYSIGDIAVFGYVHLADQAGLTLSDFPYVTRWIERVRNTPGFVPIESLLKPPAVSAMRPAA